MKKMAIMTIAMLVMVAALASIVNANSVASVSTDKAKYAQGENVLITITNNCRGPLTISGYIIENEKNERVYSQLTLGCGIIMKPGGTFSDVWMQNDINGGMAVPGIYTISIDQESIQITILAAEPAIELGTDKPIYSNGESVMIVMSNIGPTSTSICNGYWIEDSRGSVVYTPKMLAYMVPLPPGGSIVYTWDQTDGNGNHLTTGTYTICTSQDRVEIVLARGAEIQVLADGSSYASGENVDITLSNNGDMAGSIGNGYWIEDSRGNVVYAPMMLAYMRPLPVGESIEYVWDQTDANGNQVAPGIYNICTPESKITIEITEPNLDMNSGQTHSNPSVTIPENLQMPDQHFTPKPSTQRVRI
jgi:hypothetical protein